MSVAWFHFTQAIRLLAREFLKASGKYGWLGVDVFFVVSGFVIPYSLDEAKYGNRQCWVWPFIEVLLAAATGGSIVAAWVLYRSVELPSQRISARIS